MSEKIIHLTSRHAWQAAQQNGNYRAASLDSEGFIHCSTADQIVRVANAFYAGQHGLVLLLVEPQALTAELKWEPPAGPWRQTRTAQWLRSAASQDERPPWLRPRRR